MNPREYEGKVLHIEDCDQEIPKFSEWVPKGKCCCFKLAYFPESKSYFINQWEVKCTFPPIVLVLFFASFIAGFWAAYNTFKGGSRIAILVVFSFCFLLWASSYFMAMCRSPGYLPFYWAVERREEYTYEEQMDGIITNDDQFGFAKCNDYPERGSLSLQAHRLVLRADHICKWISNWVGLKNYRFFYLQLFWTFAVFVVFFVICGYEIAAMIDHYETTAPRVMLFILILPDLGFFLFFCTIFLRHTKYLFHNQTTLGEVKLKQNTDKHNYYDIGCCNNIEETCGKCSYWPLYLCPVPIPRVNDGYHWKVNRKENPYKLQELPIITLEYVRDCPTLEQYQTGTPCPPIENYQPGAKQNQTQTQPAEEKKPQQNEKIVHDPSDLDDIEAVP